MSKESWQQKFDQHRETALFCYHQASGNTRLARRSFRSAMMQVYGLDPMTIIVLVQIAIKIWAWARENGYLSEYPLHGVPMAAILDACEADGDLD